MKIQIRDEENQHDSSESKRKPLSPPTDYTSKGARARLLVLVVMLMLVLVMMNEARKPANWRWMGFDESGKQIQKEDQEKGNIVYEEVEHVPLSSPDSQDSSELKKDDVQESGDADQPPEKQATGDEQSTQNWNEEDPGNSTAIAQTKFWKLLYSQLKIGQRRELFAILRSLRNRKEFTVNDEVRGKLVQKIDWRVQRQGAELLNQLSLIEKDNPVRRQLNEQLENFQSQWKTLRPVLAGEQVASEEQMLTVNDFQIVMDQAAFADVLDGTPATRIADDPAWLRVWEDTLNPPDHEVISESVTPIQLKAQPEFYRGQPVTMTGELRGIEVLKTRKNPLGIQQFYSVWIKPGEKKIQPFNVYVTELPEDIELDQSLYTGFEGKLITVEGVFFKVRSYVDAGNNVSETPLVLAKSFQVTGDNVEAIPVAVVKRWEPSKQMLTAFWIGMPLIACVLAYWAYQSTVSTRQSPGKTMTERINKSLDDLSNDPNVQTVGEKLAQMENFE